MNIFVKSQVNNRPTLTNFGDEMSRSLPEWIGKDDDTPIPARVKLRIFDKSGERCCHCARRIFGRLLPRYDHIVALVNGGENRESNLQLLCSECHSEKTRTDIAEKSVIYQKRAKRLKLKKGRPMPGSRDSGWKRKMDGTWERR